MQEALVPGLGHDDPLPGLERQTVRRSIGGISAANRALLQEAAHGSQVREQERGGGAVGPAPRGEQPARHPQMQAGEGEDEDPRPPRLPEGQPAPGHQRRQRQVERGQEAHRVGTRAQGEREDDHHQGHGGEQEARRRAGAGRAHREDERRPVEQHDQRGDARRRLHHVIRVVGDPRRARAEHASERTGQARQDVEDVRREAFLPLRHAHHPHGLAVDESARPPRCAREQEGHERVEERDPAPAGRAKEVCGTGGHDAQRHQVRPRGEPGEGPGQDQLGRHRSPRFDVVGDAEREHHEEAAQREHGGIHRRRKRREEQEVGRRAGHEHRRGQGRARIQAAREQVRHRNENEPEEEVAEPQGLGPGAHRRQQRRREPGLERGAVGLAPHRRAPPEMPRHEADDRGVAIHRRAQRLRPEGGSHRGAQQHGQRDVMAEGRGGHGAAGPYHARVAAVVSSVIGCEPP